MSTNTDNFNVVVAGCLGGEDRADVIALVEEVLRGDAQYDRFYLNALQRKIKATLGEADCIDLIYGGATKIKGYVFESARLPEIRGASALLDFVGIDEVKRICGEKRVIYAGGGSFLALAPAGTGHALARELEQRFTELTQTALSVVVSQTFHLLELRYGCLRFGNDGLVAYWLEEFQANWRDSVLKPTLEQYYHPHDGDALPGARFYHRKNFGELVTLLTTMYHRRRDERDALIPQSDQDRDVPQPDERVLPRIERLPWVVRCASSDHRPAVYADAIYGPLSEASVRKLAVGRVMKRGEQEAAKSLCRAINWDLPDGIEQRSWAQRWEEYLRTDPGTSSFYAKKHAQENHVDPASDTHQIGAAGNGFIGLIYADGNNVGREMATKQTPEQYREFSQQLEDAACNAVFHALAEHLEPMRLPDEQGNVHWCHPFEIITIGGDDVMVIVPGDKAMEIALTIGVAFERNMVNEATPRSVKGRYRGADHAHLLAFTPCIGLGMGLVIAQADAPIFFLKQLVDELLKSAKAKRTTTLAPDNGGALDFMVLKSITMVSDRISDFRRAALEGTQCRLTARPYTWYEFAGLLDTLRALKHAKTPRSQLYRLREVLLQARDQGPRASALEYLTTRVRQSRAVADAWQEHVERCWRVEATPVGLPPWLPRSDVGADEPVWETIWADLVEIYDMLPEQQEKTYA
ncbi:hydrolase [Candidatus Chloroploca sp. Khr17]|uniref:Cas10/Cmr2 second palm domain-containing protein n=1 Tax=Candidatus Chloroploca sp. Khr17 TaxID=2496869 RepID=UPI00101C28CD|nr:hydrolase [Candidatus Chloroploca sp. Khr17]